jgi:hypothetical protein
VIQLNNLTNDQETIELTDLQTSNIQGGAAGSPNAQSYYNTMLRQPGGLNAGRLKAYLQLLGSQEQLPA